MSEQAVEIRPAAGAEDMAILRALFIEYQDWLQVDLCFQDFETELANLPGSYAPPRGALWLAYVTGELAGWLRGADASWRPATIDSSSRMCWACS